MSTAWFPISVKYTITHHHPVHADTRSHSTFLHSTPGITLLFPFLESPPRIYTFFQGPFDFLVNNANLHVSLYEFDPRPSAANMAKFEQALKDLWSPLAVIFAPENEEKAASFLGVTTETSGLLSAARNSSIDAPHYTVQSQVVGVDRFVVLGEMSEMRLPIPSTVAGLLSVDPRLCGAISSDELGLRIMDVNCRPVQQLARADLFSRDQDATDTCGKCLSITAIHIGQELNEEYVIRACTIHTGLLTLHWCKDYNDPEVLLIVAGKAVSSTRHSQLLTACSVETRNKLQVL